MKKSRTKIQSEREGQIEILRSRPINLRGWGIDYDEDLVKQVILKSISEMLMLIFESEDQGLSAGFPLLDGDRRGERHPLAIQFSFSDEDLSENIARRYRIDHLVMRSIREQIDFYRGDEFPREALLRIRQFQSALRELADSMDTTIQEIEKTSEVEPTSPP